MGISSGTETIVKARPASVSFVAIPPTVGNEPQALPPIGCDCTRKSSDGLSDHSYWQQLCLEGRPQSRYWPPVIGTASARHTQCSNLLLTSTAVGLPPIRLAITQPLSLRIDCQIGGRASLTRRQADQNQPRGAGGSACPVTKSTYSPLLFPSTWCSSYVPEIGAAVPGSNSLGPR